jgi:hypothetical protein
MTPPGPARSARPPPRPPLLLSPRSALQKEAAEPALQPPPPFSPCVFSPAIQSLHSPWLGWVEGWGGTCPAALRAPGARQLLHVLSDSDLFAPLHMCRSWFLLFYVTLLAHALILTFFLISSQNLRLQERIKLLEQEKEALQGRAETAEARVLELQREAREHDAAAGQAQERIAELQRRARERDAALQRQADAAEERARGLAIQLERTQQDMRALDVRPIAQALSGGVCTASHAELAAATRGFAAGSILGRWGFGPVYRGDLGGQAVAIKRLDQASLVAPHSAQDTSLYYQCCCMNPSPAPALTELVWTLPCNASHHHSVLYT